ncbi:MAG: S9 family peptidase, partial [Shewanella sp.]
MNRKLLPWCIAGVLTMTAQVHAQEDKYIWLEEVEGAKPMEWVKTQNAASAAEIKAFKGFDTLVANSLAILNDKERIPYATHIGDKLYNFWKDDTHVRGIYRRT